MGLGILMPSIDKIFGIGMFKTGLTSLGEALEILGYRQSREEWYHGRIPDDPWNTCPDQWSQYIPILLDRARQFDGLKDYPWMFVYREMDREFPNARFIYTMRDPEAVAASNRNLWRSRGAREESIPSRERIIQRYLDHQRSVLEYFAGRTNLLMVNWEEKSGWNELCEFLGLPLPAVPFPHANKGVYSPASRQSAVQAAQVVHHPFTT
jgi:hypothetical protein